MIKWFCCDDYGLNDKRDDAILEFCKNKKHVRISVFPFSSIRSLEKLQFFAKSRDEIQIGAHLYLSEYNPLSIKKTGGIFDDRYHLQACCFNSETSDLIISELRLQLKKLKEFISIEFVNFHHNIHHTHEFIEFLITHEDILGSMALRNVPIVPLTSVNSINKFVYDDKFDLYKKIRNNFFDSFASVFISGSRYKKWKYFLICNNVEIMFHPGDSRDRYIKECEYFDV